jgi:hypothetical protein
VCKLTLIALLLAATGCLKNETVAQQPASQLRAIAKDKNSFLIYFGGLRAGYPVARIDQELGLVPSTDRSAPTLHPYRPLWTLIYRQYGLVVVFDAMDVSEQQNGSRLVYGGNISVVTEEEAWQSLKRMGLLP